MTGFVLTIAVLVIPFVWGYFTYRMMAWLWRPAPGGAASNDMRTREQPNQRSDYLDFQI